MSYLNKLFTTKKFLSHFCIYERYFKFYSTTVNRNLKGNLESNHNPNSDIKKKCISGQKLKFDLQKNKKYNDYLETHRILDTKNTRLNTKERNRISLSIVGGGCASIYTSMLLKQNPLIKEINLIDTDDSLIGPVCDLKQVDTSIVIKHFKKNSILNGLRNSDIVALMDETHFSVGNKGPFSQFIGSCNYVKAATECIISSCPDALIAVFVHPVTASLPLVSEIFKLSGNWDPNKIVGSAALESMRIAAMTAAHLDLNTSLLLVPLCGGVDPLTIVPLLSRTIPFSDIYMN